MAKRAPKEFIIQISLDSDLKFHYQELFSQQDANTITVINGDRIAWILEPSISERMLQIDFGTVNPFLLFRNVTLRGKGQLVAGKVNFPPAYPGNRQLKYTVSLGNGLHDDPDVVPVETDGGMGSTLALDPDFKITWTDAAYQAIALNHNDVSKSANGGRATVTWKWNVGPSDPTPPFSLDFISPPPGWPATPTNSTDPNPAITLALPPGPKTKFKISTTSGNGVDGISVDGYLTITP